MSVKRTGTEREQEKWEEGRAMRSSRRRINGNRCTSPSIFSNSEDVLM
jgi:hypothetical protein